VSAPPQPAAQRLGPAALQAWLLVFVWLAMIFVFSSDAFSSTETASLLRPLLQWLLPDWTPLEIWKLHIAIRKAAHLAVYGVLALLSLRAFRLSTGGGALRHSALALLLVLAMASLDEYRQSLSVWRTGTPVDVGYDLAGAAAALGIAALARRGPRRRARPAGRF
jgi:VanZ family protein